jgi:hypothetical protein
MCEELAINSSSTAKNAGILCTVLICFFISDQSISHLRGIKPKYA